MFFSVSYWLLLYFFPLIFCLKTNKKRYWDAFIQKALLKVCAQVLCKLFWELSASCAVKWFVLIVKVVDRGSLILLQPLNAGLNADGMELYVLYCNFFYKCSLLWHSYFTAFTFILLCLCPSHSWIKQVCESSQCMQTEKHLSQVRVSFLNCNVHICLSLSLSHAFFSFCSS